MKKDLTGTVVRMMLGTDIARGYVVKDNGITAQVDVLYDCTEGEDIPIEQLRSGKVIKRHRSKHLLLEEK